ncbi:MAG: TRAP transporter TatT component family protein [Myxococcota bacterium]
MRAILSVLTVALLCSGCDLTKFAANSTANVFERAAPAGNAHWDYDLVGDALPGTIIQYEGVHRVIPDNEIIILSAARAYSAYAFGWIEDEIERTDEFDYRRVEYLQHRARYMYLRARNLSFRWIRLNHDGLDENRSAGIEQFRQWLESEFDDAEDDAPMLFWAGYTWASAINVSREDPVMLADLSFARAMVERSVALDDTYFNASGTVMLAVLNSSLSPAMGGDADEGRRLFERALEVTGRRSHTVQYNYAVSYAVQTQNVELFDSLLEEILTAPDQGNETRLVNKIILRRARRLRAKRSELFVE